VRTPAAQLGPADEIAAAAAFLASNKALYTTGYTTGAFLAIDGGLSAI